MSQQTVYCPICEAPAVEICHSEHLVEAKPSTVSSPELSAALFESFTTFTDTLQCDTFDENLQPLTLCRQTEAEFRAQMDEVCQFIDLNPAFDLDFEDAVAAQAGARPDTAPMVSESGVVIAPPYDRGLDPSPEFSPITPSNSPQFSSASLPVPPPAPAPAPAPRSAPSPKGNEVPARLPQRRSVRFNRAVTDKDSAGYIDEVNKMQIRAWQAQKDIEASVATLKLKGERAKMCDRALNTVRGKVQQWEQEKEAGKVDLKEGKEIILNLEKFVANMKWDLARRDWKG
ncbi:uncharacterized protein DSM5745_09411 [Aspergillus mulundensis]|uniref:Uncharacterized protein n=1 Tax=Aspergillus mulundensis TaxID=1810919 RepID=A0A3D8QV75_9EURO|nr:hypothetical protein DSM5745_09411 [Aspergillus mulundensis]RDW65672.1 hypothetical protein DSM5745_09411 [Aspergillus mulundensis]